MSRALKVLLLSVLAAATVLATAACGTESIKVASSNPNYAGAVLFNQRCSGCHTLSYAATHGSAANVRTAQYNNGPNFDVRCERPVTRVLYAIENGGFSGAIMPQNIVVGQQALDVARFVATYAGRKSPKVPGIPTCQQKPVGAIPAVTPAATTTAAAGATTTAKKAVAKNTAAPKSALPAGSNAKAPAAKKRSKKK